MPERLVHVALGEEDLVDASPRAERLDHGVPALDEIVLQFTLFRIRHDKTP